jgi:hypothetical protein
MMLYRGGVWSLGLTPDDKGGCIMTAKSTIFLAAAILAMLPSEAAQAGVYIGVGVPVYRPYYRPRVVVFAPVVVAPRPAVVVAVPLVVAPPPPAVAVTPAPQPVLVQPAPVTAPAPLPSQPIPVYQGAPNP